MEKRWIGWLVFLVVSLLVLSFGGGFLAMFLGALSARFLPDCIKCSLSRHTSLFLSIAIVLMGFGIKWAEAVQIGKEGFWFSAVSIVVTLALGHLLGRAFGLEQKLIHLIACGTAICGGSAIAAVSPVIKAEKQQISVAMAVVFLLNAVALVIFPSIGHYLGMGEHDFGLWSAIAIHDTSSVVGAASVYGTEALKVATTVKLVRSLWIIPVSLVSAYCFSNAGARIKCPYFIIGFVVTIILGSFIDWPSWWLAGASLISDRLVAVALFLVGTTLTPQLIKQTGARSIVKGILLWLCVMFGALAVIMA